MVITQNNIILIITSIHYRNTQEWSLSKVEALFPISLKKNIQLLFLFIGRKSTPVLVVIWQLDPGIYYLQWLVKFRQIFPKEGSAQGWMSIYYLLPGLLKGRNIKCSMK